MTWNDTEISWDDTEVSWLGNEPALIEPETPQVPYRPLPRVYLAPGFDWFDDPDSFEWVQVPGVRSADITRGRASELDQFDAGTVTVVCVDRTRTLDPGNTASPLYPHLVPNVPIKVEAEIPGGSTYVRFYGYVDGFTITPSQANRVAYVTITATDAFKLLAERPLVSVYDKTVLDLDPDLYWPLGSAQGVMLDRSGNGRDGRYLQSTQTGEVLTPFLGGSNKTVPFDEPVGFAKSAQWQNPLTLDTRVLVSFWFKSNSQPSTTDTLFMHFWPWFHLLADVSQQRLAVEFGDMDTEATFHAPVFDGEPHHIVLARDDDNPWPFNIELGTLYSDVWVYIDGVRTWIATRGSKGSIAAQMIAAYVGPSAYLAGGQILDGSISNVSLHIGDTWTLDTPRDLYEAGTRPLEGQTTGERINTVLDYIGWPAALRAIDPGEVTLQAANFQGNALEHLQQVAVSEGGRLFMSRDGKVTFHDAGRFLREAREIAVQAVFDDQAQVDAAVSDVTWRFDDEFLWDRVIASRNNGIPQEASTTAYPRRTKELSGLLVSTDREALQLAQRLAFRYQAAQYRCDGWDAKPQVRPATWPAVLGLEFGDRVRLYRTQTDTTVQDTTDLHLESYSERFDRNEYVFEQMTGSPIDPYAYVRWEQTPGWGESVWR